MGSNPNGITYRFVGSFTLDVYIYNCYFMTNQENKEQKVFEGNVILIGLLSMREDL
jgi:hypothetical protein